ncbi:zinc finger protein 883-like [Arapaima gigas]
MMPCCDILETQVASVLQVLLRAAVTEVRKMLRRGSSSAHLEPDIHGVFDEAELLSIMEKLAEEAVKKICDLVSEDCAVLHLKVMQNQNENEALKRKLQELKTGQKYSNDPAQQQEKCVHCLSDTLQFEDQLELPDRGHECSDTIRNGQYLESSHVMEEGATAQYVVLMNEPADLASNGTGSVIVKEESFEEDSRETVLQEQQNINGDGCENCMTDKELLTEPQECEDDHETTRKCIEQDSQSTLEKWRETVKLHKIQEDP